MTDDPPRVAEAPIEWTLGHPDYSEPTANAEWGPLWLWVERVDHADNGFARWQWSIDDLAGVSPLSPRPPTPVAKGELQARATDIGAAQRRCEVVARALITAPEEGRPVDATAPRNAYHADSVQLVLERDMAIVVTVSGVTIVPLAGLEEALDDGDERVAFEFLSTSDRWIDDLSKSIGLVAATAVEALALTPAEHSP